jgi:hypothetical protein
MIEEERCLEYINDILTTALSVEKEFDFSKQVGKIIELGIKEAEDRIRQETERLEAEQGIIRKIPIVGSVWNWWNPANQILRGNSFSLITTQVSEPKIQIPSGERSQPFYTPPTLSDSNPLYPPVNNTNPVLPPPVNNTPLVSSPPVNNTPPVSSPPVNNLPQEPFIQSVGGRSGLTSCISGILTGSWGLLLTGGGDDTGFELLAGGDDIGIVLLAGGDDTGLELLRGGDDIGIVLLAGGDDTGLVLLAGGDERGLESEIVEGV